MLKRYHSIVGGLIRLLRGEGLFRQLVRSPLLTSPGKKRVDELMCLLVVSDRRNNQQWRDKMYSIEELETIMYEGMCHVECSEDCGHAATIEPDGDYKCSECKKGRLVSPLVIMGLI